MEFIFFPGKQTRQKKTIKRRAHQSKLKTLDIELIANGKFSVGNRIIQVLFFVCDSLLIHVFAHVGSANLQSVTLKRSNYSHLFLCCVALARFFAVAWKKRIFLCNIFVNKRFNYASVSMPVPSIHQSPLLLHMETLWHKSRTEKYVRILFLIGRKNWIKSPKCARY